MSSARCHRCSRPCPVKLLAALALLVLPSLVIGNPITKRQFKKVVKVLGESAKEQEGGDEFPDILFQEKYEAKNLTYYYGGDKRYPVFISNGLHYVDADVHVLNRGEDYLSPKDQNDFVVLKKSASGGAGAYTVHQAHIIDIKNLRKGTRIIWNDGRVEQLKDVQGLLKQMGNSEVQTRAVRAQRPLCDWIGYTLFCNTPKNIPPARERQERQPLDEEDTEPVKLPGITDEEVPPGEGDVPPPEPPKQKRYTEILSVKEQRKGLAKVRTEVEFESEETPPPPRPKPKSTRHTTVRTTSTTTSTTTTTRPTTTITTPPPPTRSTTHEVRVVEVVRHKKQETPTTEKAVEPEEKVTKKKHKKKHKKKKHDEEGNKEKEDH